MTEPMQTIAQIRTEKGLQLFLSGSALGHILDLVADMKHHHLVDPLIADRCVLELSTKLLCNGDRQLPPQPISVLPDTPRPVADLPAPQPEPHTIQETSEIPSKKRPPSKSKSGRCPIAVRPFGQKPLPAGNTGGNSNASSNSPKTDPFV